jgi:hypothetical protein
VDKLAIPVMVLLACAPACSSHRHAATGGSSTVAGDTVTRDVPSSKETVGDIKERESKNPPPTQGDRAIPFHRIPRNAEKIQPADSDMDNSVK